MRKHIYLVVIVYLLLATFPIEDCFGEAASVPQQSQSDASMSKLSGKSSQMATRSSQKALNKKPRFRPTAVEAKKDNWLKDISNNQDNLEIIEGTSRVLRFNREISRIAVSDPDVADVSLITPTEILVNTKEKGSANIIVWDYEEAIFIYNLTIVGNPTVLKQALDRIDPNHRLDIYPTDKGFVVRGNVGTVEKQLQIANTAKAFAEDSISIVTVDFYAFYLGENFAD